MRLSCQCSWWKTRLQAEHPCVSGVKMSSHRATCVTHSGHTVSRHCKHTRWGFACLFNCLSAFFGNFPAPNAFLHAWHVYCPTSKARNPCSRHASHTNLVPFPILFCMSFFFQNSLPRCRRHLQHWNDDVRHFSHVTSERVSCTAT